MIRNIASPSPVSSPPIFTGRRNIFVVHFFLSWRSPSIGLHFYGFSFTIRFSPRRFAVRFTALKRGSKISPSDRTSSFHSFSSSSFIFPLSRFEVWKEKERGGREKKEERSRRVEKRKKKTVSFESGRIFLLLLLLLLQFSFFLFANDRIHGCASGLRTSFLSDRWGHVEYICLTNINLKEKPRVC